MGKFHSGYQGVVFKLAMMLLIVLFACTAVSWAVFDPSLTLDQRAVAAGSGIILMAILLGVTVTCFCRSGRVRIG